MLTELLQKTSSAELLSLIERLFPSEWDEQSVAYFLNNPASLGWVVRDEGTLEIVAFLIALNLGEDIDIVTIGVCPQVQRKGVATLLMQKIFEIESIKRIMLEVDVENVPAIAMYEKLGFKTHGVRKKYYRGLRDAYFMSWRRK